jgi:hypothetical protein
MEGDFEPVDPRNFVPCPQYYQASNAFWWVKIICEIKIIMIYGLLKDSLLEKLH